MNTFLTFEIGNRTSKSKIAAVPTHVPLEALYLVVGGLIVPPKENAVCTAAILDFLSCHRHFKGGISFQAGNNPKCIWKYSSNPLHFIVILV